MLGNDWNLLEWKTFGVKLNFSGKYAQSSSDYPVPDITAIPIQRHILEMIRSERKSASASA